MVSDGASNVVSDAIQLMIQQRVDTYSHIYDVLTNHDGYAFRMN